MTHVEFQLVTVENQSATVSSSDLVRLVWGVGYQVRKHYNRSGWVRRGLAPPGQLVSLPPGAKPPVGAWNLIILDHTDQQGALGWHDDEQGTEVPYAEVFAADAVADGKAVSAVVSHEAIEMLVDPYVDPSQPRTVTHDGQEWIVEACDMVEGNDYDVGAPEGRTTGLMVSDFSLPSAFGYSSWPSYSFRDSVPGPFTLAPEGYISVAPVGTTNWTQVFGERRTEAPRWSSRLSRVHGAAA